MKSPIDFSNINNYQNEDDDISIYKNMSERLFTGQLNKKRDVAPVNHGFIPNYLQNNDSSLSRGFQGSYDIVRNIDNRSFKDGRVTIRAKGADVHLSKCTFINSPITININVTVKHSLFSLF